MTKFSAFVKLRAKRRLQDEFLASTASTSEKLLVARKKIP